MVSELAGELYPQEFKQTSHFIVSTPYHEGSICSRLMKTFMLDHLGERTGMNEMTYILPEPSQTIYDLTNLPEGTIDDPIFIKEFMYAYEYALDHEALAIVPEHVNRNYPKKTRGRDARGTTQLEKKSRGSGFAGREKEKNQKTAMSLKNRDAPNILPDVNINHSITRIGVTTLTACIGDWKTMGNVLIFPNCSLISR